MTDQISQVENASVAPRFVKADRQFAVGADTQAEAYFSIRDGDFSLRVLRPLLFEFIAPTFVLIQEQLHAGRTIDRQPFRPSKHAKAQAQVKAYFLVRAAGFSRRVLDPLEAELTPLAGQLLGKRRG